MTNHPLRIWRITNGVSGGAFGTAVGVTKFAIYDYELGRRFPRPAVLDRIEKATGGAVSAATMLSAYRDAHPEPDSEGAP
jgi:transcriptional regulator with XRE-family HTH domain